MSGVGAAGDAYRRAERLAEVGRYEEAERVARQGLAAEPGHGMLLALLASVLRARREYAAALEAASAACAAAPHLAAVHAEHAECLIVMVRAREAVAAAEEAARLDPLDPAALLVLARALAAIHDYDRARAAAASGLALSPRSVEGLLTVADVERGAGDREAATAAARQALAIAPDNPYGRWLIAMLDAERLRVRRSMRGLRDVARDNPARPDVISMTWPIRGVLTGLRRGLAVGASLICLLLLVGHWWWAPAGTFARALSAVLAAVLVLFAARVLVPAGRLPWRCLALLPPMMRRADLAGLATIAAAVLLLAGHAGTGWWVLALLALVAAPVLWALGILELLGAGLDDPGYRHALISLAAEFREWWHTTRKELREAWNDPPTPGAPAPHADPEPPGR